MSRHRIVRAMDYSEEYDGFDDVYGHSVEDDNCISPSDAAQFMFDRTRQPQMSAFFNEENDIAEEDESNPERSGQVRHSGVCQRHGLSEVDEARLRSCLEEIHNVIGDSVPEQILVDTVLQNEFNLEKVLDAVLSNAPSAAEKPPAGAPKPQREKRSRDRGKNLCIVLPAFSDASFSSSVLSKIKQVETESSINLNIPGFQVKARNDPEKEKLANGYCVSVLQSLKHQIQIKTSDCDSPHGMASGEYNSLSSLTEVPKRQTSIMQELKSSEQSSQFSSLAQLANR
ncbi:hypothetical protein B7P43_G16111, partial [Cryptotermes secundus]